MFKTETLKKFVVPAVHDVAQTTNVCTENVYKTAFGVEIFDVLAL